jgi:uncharacterized protein (TIGR00725 family)
VSLVPARRRIIAVFGSSTTPRGSPAWQDAERCGRSLATAGFAVVTGGYGGTMEAVSMGASEAGGHVIGVTAPAVFPQRPGGNRFLNEERPAPSLTERIHELMAMADGVIALPGSLGTAAELLVAWNMAWVSAAGGVVPLPVVTVGDGWSALVGLLADEMAADPRLVTCAATADEAVALVVGAAGPR